MGNNKSNIGIVKLKPNTSLKTKRVLEAFFTKEKLFLGWTEKEVGTKWIPKRAMGIIVEMIDEKKGTA